MFGWSKKDDKSEKVDENYCLIIDFCGELNLSDETITSVEQIPFKVRIHNKIIYIENSQELEINDFRNSINVVAQDFSCNSNASYSQRVKTQVNNFQGATINGAGVDNSRGSRQTYNSVIRNGSQNIGVLNGISTINKCGKFNDIVITPHLITFNGYAFDIKDDGLYINGKKCEDIEDIKPSQENTEDKKMNDDEFLEYSIKDMIFEYIRVENSSDVFIKDYKNLFDDCLKFQVDGSGDIILDGQTDRKIKDFKCLVNGSGDIGLGNIKSKNLNLKVSGNGNITLIANSIVENINISLSGSGDVNIPYEFRGIVEKERVSGKGNVNYL